MEKLKMSESQIITDEKLSNIHPGEILKSWKKNHASKFESIKMYAYV